MNRILIILGSKEEEILKKRVSLAKKISEKFFFSNVILSGSNGEAEKMEKLWGKDALLEKASLTTRENLLLSKIFTENGDIITIVTDCTHKFRTYYLAKRIFPQNRIEIYTVNLPLKSIVSKILYEVSRLIRNAFE